MTVRLNITMDEDLYRRLKKELPSKGISAFIGAAVKAKLVPSNQALDAAYKAASSESWRRELSRSWKSTDAEGWPD